MEKISSKAKAGDPLQNPIEKIEKLVKICEFLNEENIKRKKQIGQLQNWCHANEELIFDLIGLIWQNKKIKKLIDKIRKNVK